MGHTNQSRRRFILVFLAFVVIATSGSAIAASVSYAYDAAGRLTRVEYAGGRGFTYQYDNAGNLLSRTALEPSGRRRPVRHSSRKPPSAPAAATRTVSAPR